MPWYNRRALLRWQALLFCFAAVVVGVIGLRNFIVIGVIPESTMGWIYLLTTVLGHPLFLIFVVFAVFFAPLTLLLPERRLIRVLATVFCIVGTILWIVDSFVYTQYRFHLGGFTFTVLFGELVNLDQVFRFPLKFWLSVGTIFLSVTMLYVLAGNWLWRRYVSGTARARPVLIASTIVVLYLAGNGVHAIAEARYDRTVTRLAHHLPLQFPLTAKTFFSRTGLMDLEQHRRSLRFDQPVTSTSLRYPLNPMQCRPRETRMNVLMIVIDAMRYDALAAGAAPTVSDLVKQSWNFSNHYSGGNITGPGLFSLFYGIPGTYWNTFVSEQQRPVLMTLLADSGYDINILSGHSLSRPPFDRTIFAGVEKVTTRSYEGTPMEQDQRMTEDFLHFLDETSEPFFGFLFYKTTHGHYLPMPLPEIFSPAATDMNYLLVSNALDPVPYHNRYLNAVHHVDTQIARVFDAMEQRGLLEDALIIITSEHGEEFNDNALNYWGHGSNFTAAQLHVPLIIRWPGDSPETIGVRTTHFDVAPTLIRYLFDCRNPISDYSVGRDLRSDFEPFEYGVFASYFNYAIVEPDRINLSYADGRFGILDPRFAPLPEAEPRNDILRRALNDMSRFYKH